MRNRIKHILLSSLIAACMFALTACGSTKNQPHSNSLDRKALMSIVFPGWKDIDGKRIFEVTVPMNVEGGKKEPVSTMANILPIYVVKLDDGHAVMLTHTLPLDSDNRPLDCHESLMYKRPAS